MDSNFQVKITADISNLQASIKSAQSTLNSLKATSENTSGSFNAMSQSINRVGGDMNRARLATFAFGQVIRDAGFFSQSFGLGVLAISNNIPILIDQLVLLSGVSAGFGAALSVIGSALAAGLTVFAYWAQGVERNGGTVSGAIKKMGEDSESAIGRLVNYLSTPPASNMLSAAVAGLEEAVGLIKQIMEAAVDFSISVWNNFGSDISTIFRVFYGIIYNTMNNVLNIFRFAASIIKGDFGGAFEALGNIAKNVINNIIGLIQIFVKTSSTLLGTFVSTFDPLKGAIIKAAGEQLVQFGDGLKFASDTADVASFSFRDFFDGLFKGGKQVDETTESLDKLRQSRDRISQKLYGKMSYESLPGLVTPRLKDQVKPVELFPSKLFDYQKEQLKNFVLEMMRIEQQIDDIFTNGIALTIGNAMMAIGDAFATGGNIGKAFGKAILGSLASVLSQFGDMLIAASLAGLTFSTALANLFNPANWGVALAAGIALKIAAGALGGFARNPSGGNNMAMPPTGQSGPNFLALPTAFQNGTMSMAGNNQMTLQTRISGNDLAILVNRADRNRNGYY